MKKKIAIFANSWNFDIVSSFIKGYSETLKAAEADTFMFLAANSYGRPENNNKSEVSIHSFPDLNDFDSAVVFSQGLNSNEVRDLIYEHCEETGIPTFCVGDVHPGFHGLLVKTEKAMIELCEHLYTKHDVRRVAFFGGPEDNGDSNLRLQAVKDFAAMKKDFILDEKDIFFTNWEVRKCMEAVMEHYSKKENLPDAMIFANDFLAISASMALDTLGFSVPEDVLITGFDYVKSGQTYFPSIATINQCYDAIGELCAKSIIQIFEGKEVPEEQYVDGEFKPGESCGCINPRNEDQQRRQYCHSLIGKEYEMNARTGVIYGLRAAFQESSRFSTLPYKLQSVINNAFHNEIQTFYMMLDPTLERIGQEDPDKLPQCKYVDKMQVVVSRRNGQVLKTGQNIHKREIIPEYDGEGPNEFYFIMPLYIDTFVVGYFVMNKTDAGLRDWVYQEYEACLTQSLTYYKTNIRLAALNDKLSELMQTDALTSLKNRTAYENMKTALKNKYLAQDCTQFAAVMFDLNDLKKINDELGHGAGDIYIKSSSELICNTFKHSPVFRIGGDEFVAIVKNTDYDERFELLEKFRSEVERLQREDVPLVNRVSVASGMADSDEIENEDIETMFEKADERMYENKRLMKAKRAEKQ